MTSPRFTSDFGPIVPLTDDEAATVRAKVTEHAHTASDAEMLCDMLGVS